MYQVKHARRSVGIVLLAVALIFLLTMLLQTVMVTAIDLFAPHLMEDTVFLNVAGSLVMYAIAMPLTLLVFLRARPVMRPEKRRMTFADWIFTFSLCFSVSILFSVVGNVINTLFKTLLGQPPVNDLEAMTAAFPFWVNLLLLAVLAPIFEELFLRKLVIDRLLPYGELPAVLISGIAFGLVHGNFSQLFYAVGGGIIFGMVYVKTGKIRINITLHALLNFIGGVYTSLMQKALEGNALGGILKNLDPVFVGTLMSLVYYVILIATFSLAFAFILNSALQHRRLNLKKSCFTPWQWARIILFNLPVWLFAAVVALMFVM